MKLSKNDRWGFHENVIAYFSDFEVVSNKKYLVLAAPSENPMAY